MRSAWSRTRALAFFVAMIPLSMTMLWLSERLGGGVWAAVLAHVSGNASLALLPQSSIAASLAGLVVTTAIASFAWWRMRAYESRRGQFGGSVLSAGLSVGSR